MISENKRTNNVMDWNIRPPPDSSLQATNFEFQGPHLEQQFPAAGGFSQDPASTQNPCTYPGNNQIINIPSSTIIANKLPLQSTGGSSSLQPFHPKTSKTNKGFGPPKHLRSVPPVSLSAVFVQMTPSVTQNSNLMKNVHTSSYVVLQGSTVNPVQNIPQKRVNPYMARENYNNQSQQVCSNSVRTSVYPQAYKNNLSPKSQPTLVPYCYVNGPPVSQADATVPLNSLSNHYLSSQQNLSYAVHPVGQNNQNQINGQNASMTVTVQSQPYASAHINHIPYSVPTYGHNRNATQISLYTVPTQVTNKPPPYPVPSVQTNYGQFSLPQPVANIPNENVQNYHSPMPDLNTTSYSAHYGQKGLSTQIFRDTNAVDSIAYNINERGSESQCSNESRKSSVEFRESLNSMQAARIVSAGEALTPQTSQTLQSQKNPSNVTGNFPDNLAKDKLKITKESLALDYKKIHEIELALLKLGEAFKRKCKIFLSAEKNKQVADLSAHNLNQNLNQSCNVTQNKPSHDASPALQFPSKDASQNQSFSASCDSNQNKEVPSLPRKADPRLLPILQSLLEGTADENMVLDAFFANKVTDQNRRLAVSGSSSSSLSVSSGDKSEYNVNNTVSTAGPSPQVSQMNSTQESLPSTKNDLGLMHTSKSANRQLEKITAASSGHLFCHFRLNRGALETLRHYFNQRNQSSIQSPADSQESFLSRNKAVESSENSSNSLSACPILMQKPEKNIETGNEYVSDASSSASVLSERVVVGQEAGTVQSPNPTISADSFRNGGICSLEELKTSLALWTKSLPPSLKGQLCESTQSAVSLFSSEDGKDDKMPQQSLENLINTLNQNDQAKDASGSDQTTQSSVPISLGKNHDLINSSLSKGCEPQVAIVTPLMLSKDNVQMAVQKNSPCLEITSPTSIGGRVHSLEKSLSAVLHSDKGIHSNSSPSELIKYCKDWDVDQKAVISTQENGIVKAEIGENSYELSQVVGSHSLELKDQKSQVGSGPNLPLDNQISQECALSQTGSDLLKPRNADKVSQNDSMLQITSVCTLVEGDAFYNSQIASIFGTSPLKSSIESDTTLKDLAPCLQCNDQQSGILKTEPESEISVSVTDENAELPLPYTLTKAVEEVFKEVPGLEISQSHKISDEMNERNSEIKNSLLPEGKPLSEKKLEQNVSCNSVYSTDLVSDDRELSQNKGGQLNSSSADGLCAINKEGVSAEDNLKHSGNSTETPVTLLNDQLTELSKEFPYGIGYLKTLNVTENNIPVPKHNDRGHKENIHISEKSPDPPDAVDQIKVKILSSQQIKEVFPEHTQQFTIKSENAKDDYFRTNSEDNLTRESIDLIKTDKAIDVEARTTSSETTLKQGERTYCCLHGWLASGYAVPPCSCMRIKESGSSQKVDLCSRPETIVKDRPKASGNCNVDFQLTSQLPTSTLETVTKKDSSGTQSDRTLNTISGHTDANEHKPHRVDQAASPLLSLEKLNLQKPKQTDEHIRKELSHHASSQSIKTEMEAVEIDLTHDHVQARDKLSTEEVQYLSNTEDVVVARNVCRSDSSSKQRTEKIVVKSKTNTPQHKRIEIKHSINYERYKIKRDSSETHMIRGPTLSKGLKRQKAMERKHKVLVVQHNDAINASDLASVSSFSKCGNPEYISTAHSQNHLNAKKFGKIDLEKHYGYKKVERKEPTYSERSKHHSEYAEHHSECTKPVIKRINLEKYAYSKDRKNTWKCRSSHLNSSKTLTPQKLRVRPPNISKMLSPGKEAVLDANKKEKWSERSLSDKKSCFNRRTSKLSISLQREPKKTYLNRVAFRRTAHKTICLTNLEPSHSKSVWHVKSSSLSGWSRDKRKSSSPPQQPEAEKPPMLEFKMCPDILFRNPVTEEQVSDAKKLLEKDTVPVTAVKSKREDWLNYDPVKRRKTEEKEAQADDEIPLDTAIKLLDRNDMLGTPLKDSQTTFETYRKMHLEKRSRSLDSSPLN